MFTHPMCFKTLLLYALRNYVSQNAILQLYVPRDVFRKPCLSPIITNLSPFEYTRVHVKYENAAKKSKTECCNVFLKMLSCVFQNDVPVLFVRPILPPS